MKKTTQMRQGDVFLTKVEAMPDGAAEIKGRRADLVVLAEGETTGHLHAIPATQAHLFAVGAERYLRVLDGAWLRHGTPQRAYSDGDHEPLELPAGTYRVTIDREYQPDGWRRVID